MSAREQVPSNHGEDPAACPAEPTLSAVVLAAHLRWCAAELAESTSAGGIRTVDELGEIIPTLVESQRRIASTLGHLGRNVTDRSDSVTSAAETALIEVLRAAAIAASHTAEALAETGPLIEMTAGDTRL